MRVRRAQSVLRLILILLVSAVVLAGIGWGLIQYLRPVVTVTEAVKGPLVQAFYSTGTVQPEREYPIRSNIAGTIDKVLVDKGTRVKRGDPLAVVIDPALLFTADKAKAELEEKLRRADPSDSPVLAEYDARLKGTRELLEIAQREVSRVTALMQSSAGSQNDMDRAMDRVKGLLIDSESVKAQRDAKKLELNREVEVAKSALHIAEWNVEQQTLKAPIDGVILDRPTSVGTRVAVNDQLMRIADVNPANMVMRADVDEEDVARVHVDQPVRMTLYSFPGRVLDGKVIRIYDQADAARRTFEVDVKFDVVNGKLLPGMTGELAFVMETKPSTLVVPAQALQGGFIYSVRDHQLQKANVKIGLKSIERVEILEGLQPGDRVLISPVGTMSDGQIVRTTFMDPAAAAGLNKPPPITEAFKGF